MTPRHYSVVVVSKLSQSHRNRIAPAVGILNIEPGSNTIRARKHAGNVDFSRLFAKKGNCLIFPAVLTADLNLTARILHIFAGKPYDALEIYLLRA